MLERVPHIIRRHAKVCAAKYLFGQWQVRRAMLGALLLTGLLLTQWALPLTGLAISFNPDNAAIWSRPSYERKMNEIGNRILTANHIQTPILFRMSENAMELDAKAESKQHLILVGSALFPMVSSDDELAAILSHEIAHIITGKSGHLAGGQISMLDILGTVIFVPEAILTTASMGQSIKERLGRATLQNRETAMDLIGIDLMVKAGYNPNAMESILREIATDNGNKHWRNRVTISTRLQRIHGAIAAKYPNFLPTEERTPATPEQPAKDAPVNTVSVPTSPENATAQLGAVQVPDNGSDSSADLNNSNLKQGQHARKPSKVGPTLKTRAAVTGRAEPIQAAAPEVITEVKNVLPKPLPTEATKTSPAQQLLDQNGQPMPATPPGLPAALRPAG